MVNVRRKSDTKNNSFSSCIEPKFSSSNARCTNGDVTRPVQSTAFLRPILILSFHLTLGMSSGSFQLSPLKLFMHLFWNKFVGFGFHELSCYYYYYYYYYISTDSTPKVWEEPSQGRWNGGGMRYDGGNRSTWGKSALATFCPQVVSHELIWDWTWGGCSEKKATTVWDTARPSLRLSHGHCQIAV
jgi:hypothetical protein